MPTLSMSPTEMLLAGVSTVFESLGRELLCLGPDFRIVHVSEGLDPALVGRPVEGVLGPELFGEHGPLRRVPGADDPRRGPPVRAAGAGAGPRRLDDLVPQVDGVLSAMDFFDKTAGAQLLFI